MHVKTNISRFLHFIFYYFIIFPILLLINYIVFGLIVEGRENLKGIKGAVVICNHIHTLDCTMIGIATFPRRATLVSQKENFELPVAGWFVKHLGSISTGKGYREKKTFYIKAIKKLNNDRIICIYPEGELISYYEGIREFKKGAFLIAAKTNAPIVPMYISQRKCTGIRRLYRRKPLFSITIAKPIYASGSNLAEKSKYLYEESIESIKNIIERTSNTEQNELMLEVNEST